MAIPVRCEQSNAEANILRMSAQLLSSSIQFT